jgi:hypothetical protein
MTKGRKVGQILLEIKGFTYLKKMMPHQSGLVKICPQKLKAYHITHWQKISNVSGEHITKQNFSSAKGRVQVMIPDH